MIEERRKQEIIIKVENVFENISELKLSKTSKNNLINDISGLINDLLNYSNDIIELLDYNSEIRKEIIFRINNTKSL